MAAADVTHQTEAPQARTIHARLVGAHFETEQSLRECAAGQLAAALREQLAVALLELEAAMQILDRLGIPWTS